MVSAWKRRRDQIFDRKDVTNGIEYKEYHNNPTHLSRFIVVYCGFIRSILFLSFKDVSVTLGQFTIAWFPQFQK